MNRQGQGDEENKAVTLFQHGCRAMQSAMREEEGVTAIEYALLAALIAIVILTSVTAVGSSLLGLFTAVSNAVAAAASGL